MFVDILDHVLVLIFYLCKNLVHSFVEYLVNPSHSACPLVLQYHLFFKSAYVLNHQFYFEALPYQH